MEWRDRAVVLAARSHGESSVVASLLTREHGRHAGLVRGGAGRRRRGDLQPGNRLGVGWRGRLADHLGSFECELERALAPAVLGDRGRLAAVVAACTVLDTALPDREPMPDTFAALEEVLDALETRPDWAACYVRWELALLADLGYGLDLDRCAVTGAATGLVWVSPRSGRAVTAAAGAPWQDRLLPLPAFLRDAGAVADPAAVADGLALTGHFLARHVYGEHGRAMPPARLRLAEEVLRRPPSAE